MNGKKIVIFNTLYHPYKIGGAENSVRNLAESLVAEGHSVSVCTLCGESDELSLQQDVNGINVIRIKVNDKFWPFSKHIRNPIFIVIYRSLDIFGFWRFFLVKKIVKNLSPNIVITNNIFGFGFWIWLASKYCKVKIYHVSRDYYLSCIRQTCFKDNKACKSVCGICSIYSLPNKLASSLVDHHIAISDYISAYFSNAGFFSKAKKTTIYNTVSKDGKIIEGTLIKPRSISKVGFMGRLENEKGFDIFKSLAEENRDLEFYAAGVGGEGDVPQNLRCLGYMDSKVFLSMLDLLVVPSRWNEPFGRVVIEALALNIPVIVSRMGGLSELINERYTIDVDNFISSFRDVVNDIEVNGYRVEVLENTKSYGRLISDEYDGR